MAKINHLGYSKKVIRLDNPQLSIYYIQYVRTISIINTMYWKVVIVNV